ncbi:tetratricopeptide repeat protein [Shimia aestuarii]|uniref:Tetratricopeptide repeat-containing protein n=1 Tax=Shimia aestuarii TaxID=254406 RepID=A0A1I4I0V5_9RHOB|nr:tetratricopeptide repeat protein [Shimia aestuarii]SFL47356.1 Tetratricopeptide repeat-containing protein [Shimia aestuarii]
MASQFIRSVTLSALLAAVTLPVQAQQQDGLSGSYLAARQASYSADFDAAARYYSAALARDPGNPVLLENAVLAFLSLGQVDRAMPVARKMVADGHKSQLAHMVLAAGLVRDGEYTELLERLDEDGGVGPLVDGLLAAWAEIGRGDMSKALAAFDDVSKKAGLAGFAAYHKALALASVGDFEGAEKIYATGDLQGAQMTRRGIMAQLEILSQVDKSEEALARLDEVFGSELDPDLQEMRDRLAAGEMLPFTHVTNASDGVAEVFFSLASALQNEANADYTLLYTRIAEFLRPDHTEALLLSAELLEMLGQHELATQAFKRVPADHPSFHAAELGRAEALRASGKIETAIEVLEQLSRSHGNLPIVHTALGDLLRQERDFAGAVQAYDAALAQYDETEQRQWFIYYARGISHERLGNWDKAESDFRKALDLNPEQPQVLNYLGYSLVEKQEKLDEALDMIERAVAARPDSGYIVDSLGWVLFRLGRYEEAVDHMERATELMPVDPVVNDHLGDVYWAVGRHLEAEFQWRRALSFVDEETAEEAKPDRIRRKLEVGLDVVLEEEGAPPLKVANDG